MNEHSKEIEDIDGQIRILKERKNELKTIIKGKKGSNQSNILRRMSTKFFHQMDVIDKNRESFGFDPLSLPEKTELVIKHKSWDIIKQDITHFNKEIEVNGGIANEQKT